MTFAVSRLLSQTVLKGVPSSFTLELPPYRTPQVGQGHRPFHLGPHPLCAGPGGGGGGPGRAVDLGDGQCDSGRGAACWPTVPDFLDPFAQLMGLDGVILMAFILGFPANEIVLPIIIMAYLATGQPGGLWAVCRDLQALLVRPTAGPGSPPCCTMLFSLYALALLHHPADHPQGDAAAGSGRRLRRFCPRWWGCCSAWCLPMRRGCSCKRSYCKKRSEKVLPCTCQVKADTKKRISTGSPKHLLDAGY